jgi:hypothetical protein
MVLPALILTPVKDKLRDWVWLEPGSPRAMTNFRVRLFFQLYSIWSIISLPLIIIFERSR